MEPSLGTKVLLVALVGSVPAVVLLVVFWRSSKVRRRWLASAVGLALAWVLAEYFWLARHRAEAWCEHVAAMVVAHAEINGELPQSLGALDELPPFPSSILRSIRAPHYECEGTAFVLSFLVAESGGSNSGTIYRFANESRSWTSIGYIGPG